MDTVHVEDAATTQEIKYIGLKAVVARANGEVEDLGTVSEYHRDPQRMAEAQAQGIGTITLCA
jgi:hypothetical protein